LGGVLQKEREEIGIKEGVRVFERNGEMTET
jgi:hypothetical protein